MLLIKSSRCIKHYIASAVVLRECEKKFKTLTSVKKNLGSLTKNFGKSRKFFLLKKKNVFLKRKNFLLKRKKILLQRKFSGGRSQKKEGSDALLNLYANIHQKSAISKSAFRAKFTKVNSFASSFAISDLSKKAIFANPILEAKIEMHEKYQSRFFGIVYYELWIGACGRRGE